MMAWWRENRWAGIAAAVIRIWLGWQWLTAGFRKLTDGFTAEGFLKNAVSNPVTDKATNELVYPTFTGFLEHVALPNVQWINLLVPMGEFLVGLGLILGAFTTAAAFFGILMNLMFMFAGTVSTNPWLAMLGFIVFAAGAGAGRYGADRYLIPFLRRLGDRIRRTKLRKPGGRPKTRVTIQH